MILAGIILEAKPFWKIFIGTVFWDGRASKFKPLMSSSDSLSVMSSKSESCREHELKLSSEGVAWKWFSETGGHVGQKNWTDSVRGQSKNTRTLYHNISHESVAYSSCIKYVFGFCCKTCCRLYRYLDNGYRCIYNLSVVLYSSSSLTVSPVHK